MAYSVIDPNIWDNPNFCQLDAEAQLLWLYLLTGPEADGACPGLVQIGCAGLAEARRSTSQAIYERLAVLERAGWAEVDHQRRIVRLPNAPEYKPPGNPNVVRGWYRKWKGLPSACELKWRHLDSLQAWLPILRERSAACQSVWEQTFGKEIRDLQAIKALGKHNGSSPEALKKVSSSQISILNPSGSSPEGKRSDSTIRDPKSGSVEGGPGGETSFARGLWEIQETLRATIPGLPPRSFGPLDRERVERALSLWEPAQLEHALRVFHADAVQDYAKARFFDGVVNWSPKALERAVSMPIAVRDPRHGQFQPEKEFKDGRII